MFFAIYEGLKVNYGAGNEFFLRFSLRKHND